MGNFLSKLFGKNDSSKTKTQQQANEEKKQQTRVPKQQTVKDKINEKVMTNEEKQLLEFCTSGKMELDKIAVELAKEDISMTDALNWYVKSLDYSKCDTCTEVISTIEELYTKFVVLKLKQAVENSQSNRSEVEETLNTTDTSTLTIQTLTSIKTKLQKGQDSINEILTSVPESNKISTAAKRANLTIADFKLSNVDDELNILSNLFSRINNLLMSTFKDKQLQQVKKFFELVLVGTNSCSPEYYVKDNAVNNPGNILISEIITLEGYKQLLRFAPLQPLLMFHDAMNNPLLKDLPITDKFICDYIGIERITTIIKETKNGVEIKDGITGTGKIESQKNFYLNGKKIVGTGISYRKDIYDQDIPYFITKSGFTIDLGIYNGNCHTVYYMLDNADTFSIMQTYKIGEKNYVLMCETNTWFDQKTKEQLDNETSQLFNNSKTEKTFVSQTDIIIHKEATSEDEFTVSINFETKNSNITNNIFKQYLINLIAYYNKIIFGNGGLDRDTFSNNCGLTSFMKEETKDYVEFFTKGTEILKKIWEKYPAHLLNMCSYANKSIPSDIEFKLPTNYPRFSNSEEVASKFIMNRIINYTTLPNELENIIKDKTKKVYFETVNLSEYPYSTDSWDIDTYPTSETGPVYEFELKNGTTNEYDNHFDYLFNQVTSTLNVSSESSESGESSELDKKDEPITLNIIADDVIGNIDIDDLKEYKRKPNTWNIGDVLNDQSLSMQLYTKFILGALRWQMILPFNTLNSTIFINKNDSDNGCPEDNLLAFLLTPRVKEDGTIYDPLFNTKVTKNTEVTELTKVTDPVELKKITDKIAENKKDQATHVNKEEEEEKERLKNCRRVDALPYRIYRSDGKYLASKYNCCEYDWFDRDRKQLCKH